LLEERAPGPLQNICKIRYLMTFPVHFIKYHRNLCLVNKISKKSKHEKGPCWNPNCNCTLSKISDYLMLFEVSDVIFRFCPSLIIRSSLPSNWHLKDSTICRRILFCGPSSILHYIPKSWRNPMCCTTLSKNALK